MKTKIQQSIIELFIVSLFIQSIALIVIVQSLSISPGTASGSHSNHKSIVNPRSIVNQLNNQAQHSIASIIQQQQQPIETTTTTTTTIPSLVTTLAQGNNYIDSLQQNFNKQQQDVATPVGQQQDVLRPKSIYEEQHADDSVPLATINNHSRNNQAAIRPPQYVDVSALVGRDRNSTGSPGNSTTNSNGVQTANGILAPKSRSGLPECATQQVCNAIFVRMNYTQRLCECSSNYNWKCSHNLDPQDGHTIELTRKFDKRIYTQIKTCEPLRDVRACKSPTDWTLLALQSERSGKAHYVVVCKCPTWAQLEGPYTHNHPPYANIPGIRVYGMLCAHQTARSSSAQSYSTYNSALGIYPEFPWTEALNVLNTTNLLSTLDSS